MRQKFYYYCRRYGFVRAMKALWCYVKNRSINTLVALGISIKYHPWNTPMPKHRHIAKFRVLFLTFSYPGESKRYRVYNMIEYLKIAGIESAVLFVEDLDRIRNYALGFDLVVLFRLTLDAALATFISDARRLNIPVVYSTDDFLFDKDSIERYARLPKGFGQTEVAFYREEAGKQRAAIERCDFFLSSTDALATQAGRLGKESFVIHNGLNQEQVDVSARAVETRVKRDGIVIGYFSGTKTHDYDFQSIKNALLRILNDNPSVTLLIVGFLDLDDAFRAFKKQIIRSSFVPWRELPEKIANVDINIVPLEIGNPIVEAKSELKYFEAGIVGVPTIASATNTYQHAITSGENGLLAFNEDDWYYHLHLLIDNERVRNAIGEKAHQHTVSHYTPRPMSEQTKAVFEEIYDR